MNRFTRCSSSRRSGHFSQLRSCFWILGIVGLRLRWCDRPERHRRSRRLVKDPSGAVIAGAKVRITDTERGTELVTTTNAQGEFVVTPLKIGRYQLTVEKTGFKKTVAGPIIVNVDSRPSVDIVLSVGSIRKSSASPPRLHYWKRKLPIWGIWWKHAGRDDV